MDESGEFLKKCTEMVKVVEKLSEEIPKIKKMFMECQQLRTEITTMVEENEKKMKEQFLENKQLVELISAKAEINDKNMKKMFESYKIKLNESINQVNMAIKRYDMVCSKINNASDILEEFYKYNKRVKGLEECVNKINQTQKSDSLYEVIKRNGGKLPLAVHKKGWSEDFHFIILRIDKQYAHGDTYDGKQIYKKNAIYKLEQMGYIEYIGK